MYGIGLIISLVNPMIYYRYLSLDGYAILHGQIWRIITFLCYPPVDGIFFGILALYLYYSMGQTLERVWGAFRFNAYFLLGIIGHVLAEIIITLIFGVSPRLLPVALDFSLFFAFALTFPDVEFLLMFLIPDVYKRQMDGLFFDREAEHFAFHFSWSLSALPETAS